MDAAWNWLMWILPNAEVGAFEIKDWLNVGIAAIGVWLAVIATRIAKKQDVISDQLRLKSAELQFRDTSQSRSGQHTIIPFEIINTGTKGATGFHWEIFLDHVHMNNLTCITEQNRAVGWVAGIVMQDGTNYDQWDAFRPEVIFPGSALVVARVRVFTTIETFKVLMRVRYEDGTTPEKGFLVLRFNRSADLFYDAMAMPDEYQA